MKADAYQVITDRIVGLLEQGVIPWQKPWQSGQSMPRNLISKRGYRGVNVFLLHAMMCESPFWLTFNQAKELGGHIKAGAAPAEADLKSWRYWMDAASAMRLLLWSLNHAVRKGVRRKYWMLNAAGGCILND